MTIYKEIPDRLQSIANMRHEGKTFDEIGKNHNISRERARQLFMKYLKIVQFNKSMNHASDNDILKLLYKANETLDNNTNNLVIKTYMALNRSGFLTEENSKKLLSNQYSDDQLLRIRNFGVKSLKLLHTAIDIYNKC